MNWSGGITKLAYFILHHILFFLYFVSISISKWFCFIKFCCYILALLLITLLLFVLLLRTSHLLQYSTNAILKWSSKYKYVCTCTYTWFSKNTTVYESNILAFTKYVTVLFIIAAKIGRLVVVSRKIDWYSTIKFVTTSS